MYIKTFVRLVGWFGWGGFCVEGFMRTVGGKIIALEESGCIIICLSSVHCYIDPGEGV